MSHRLIKFAIVGGVGFIADASTFFVSHYLFQLHIFSARVIAFFIAATVTWLGNRLFTFNNKDVGITAQWFKFMLGACVSAIPNFMVFKSILFMVGDEGIAPMMALVVGILAGMVSNYLISSFWVFRPKKSTE
ncbi:GtrA family protein [Vibrio aquaticus]|uniref:GtrA family protein n=1 Tax=Vibrio aquaticus TaxID=2496559 RepID=A0A3S0MJR8_9VIBR|nr:GtrA family protein [Vibrio aquaticus]